ncbi:serine kinase [Dyadobacter arcticus]|uniref:Serine kinase n=1 Tax=Dyadobacter arcticus TaxID=1078754 RepID=A0ABX0UIT9_9BACT|nr:serine kinase [Dyadobacter arcticus]NIJ52004.1 hypothetical protein [Dyadobacter arcticus]
MKSETHFYKAFGLNISSEIELPELIKGDEQAAVDLQIRKGAINLPITKKTNIYRRAIRADFGQDHHNHLYLNWNGVASFKAIGGTELIVSTFTEDRDLISLFTVSEALGLILFQRGYFLLHASAVQVGDESWCFMGNPGAGKSTTAAAFIKAGCKLLSDDLTAIMFDAKGIAYVIPAYPQLKIWVNTVNGLGYDKALLEPVSEGVNKYSYKPESEFPDAPVKLREIFFLHKARNRKAMELLTSSEVPTKTLQNFPLPVPLLTGDELKKHFLQSFKCAKAARMWNKRRPEGFGMLEKWVEESIARQLIAG